MGGCNFITDQDVTMVWIKVRIEKSRLFQKYLGDRIIRNWG